LSNAALFDILDTEYQLELYWKRMLAQAERLLTPPIAQVHPVALEVAGLTAGYGAAPALENVSFHIHTGKRVALVGPNGAGKSTLFKALVGLIPMRNGAIRINGESGLEARRLVAYVPQTEAVDWSFPVSVLDVAVMGLARKVGWFRLPNRYHREMALSALERLGIAHLKDRQIGELSGGQKRRVFIARALAQGANILLLDEPFAGVDHAAQDALFGTLDELRADGVTVLLATHDLNTVSSRFDELLILNRRVYGYGTPDAVFNPETLAGAFGSQLAIWREGERLVMLADQCCP
jgi:ABC-type Mn2+/Zn2+ transport system ATPase subunit